VRRAALLYEFRLKPFNPHPRAVSGLLWPHRGMYGRPLGAHAEAARPPARGARIRRFRWRGYKLLVFHSRPENEQSLSWSLASPAFNSQPAIASSALGHRACRLSPCVGSSIVSAPNDATCDPCRSAPSTSRSSQGLKLDSLELQRRVRAHGPSWIKSYPSSAMSDTTSAANVFASTLTFESRSASCHTLRLLILRGHRRPRRTTKACVSRENNLGCIRTKGREIPQGSDQAHASKTISPLHAPTP